MASDGEVSCVGDPNFAVICSFLEVFGQFCPFETPNILELQELLENTQEVKDSLRELHVKLLRRALKTVSNDRWERYLVKFCHSHGYRQEAWELERFGYKKSNVKIKLKILKVLLEYQFTCNVKFKAKINELDCNSLRLEPVGQDRKGRSYWLHVDASANVRLYREDNEEETWRLIARDREGLVKVISQLKSNSDEDDDDTKELTVNEDSSGVEDSGNQTEEVKQDIEEVLKSEKQEIVDNIEEVLKSEKQEIVNNASEKNAGKFQHSENEDDSNEEFLSPESEPESDEEVIKNDKDETANDNGVNEKTNENQNSEGVQVEHSKENDGKKSENISISLNKDVTNTESLDKIENTVESPQLNPVNKEPLIKDIDKKEVALLTTSVNSENISKTEKSKINQPLEENKVALEGSKSSIIDAEETIDKLDDKNKDSLGEAIEEPVMIIKGDGNGADCESSPFFIGEDCESSPFFTGEEICEPVMYFWGLGEGYECETGNTSSLKGKKDKNNGNCQDQEESVKKRRGKATKSTVKNDSSPPIIRNANSLRKKPSTITPIPVTKRVLKVNSEPETKITTQRKKTRLSAGKLGASSENVASDTQLNDSDKNPETDSVSNSIKEDSSPEKSKSNNLKSDKATPPLGKKGKQKGKQVPKGNKLIKKALDKRKTSISSVDSNRDDTDKSLTDSKGGKHKSDKKPGDGILSKTEVESLPSKKLRLESTTDDPEHEEADIKSKVRKNTRKKINEPEQIENEQKEILKPSASEEKTNHESNNDSDDSPKKPNAVETNNVSNPPTRKSLKGRRKKVQKIKRSIQKQSECDSDTNLNEIATESKKKKSEEVTVVSLKDKRKRARDQSDSISEDENEELQAGKRLKIKPKKVLLATRRKVENKLKNQKGSSEDSEDKEIKPRKMKKTKKGSTSGKSKGKKEKKTALEEQEKSSEDNDSQPLSNVRQSRRLAQLKIREEAERRQLEEEALRELKIQHKKKSGKTDSDQSEWDASAVQSQEEEKPIKKRKKRNHTSAEESSESEEPEYEPEPEPDLIFDKSDHEFSPESDLETNDELPPVRQARTLKEAAEAKDCDGCVVCGKGTLPEWILLCDGCDKGFHAACLQPILFLIPSGDWFCPTCRHERLIEALENKLEIYDKLLKVVQMEAENKPMENKEEKKESEAESESEYETDSSDDSGRVYRLRERKALPVSYRFKEYDQIMSTAIKEEIKEEDVAAGNQGRGKDISTIIEAVQDEKKQEEWKKKRSRRKPRKLNSLEVPSEDEDSDDDFKETGWSTSDSESISNENENNSSESSDSDEILAARRSRRPKKHSRRKMVESPEIKKKKGIYHSDSSESSGTKDWKDKAKKKSSPKKIKVRRPKGTSTPKIKRHSELKQYDADGNVIRRRVEYGGLSSDGSHDWSPKHRTRQKKINYTEMPNTESEDEMHKPSGKHMPDSSDEFRISSSEMSGYDAPSPKPAVFNPLTLKEIVKNHLQGIKKEPVAPPTRRRKRRSGRGRGGRRGGRGGGRSSVNTSAGANSSTVQSAEKSAAQEERDRKKAEKDAAKAARAADRQAKLEEKQKLKDEREKARLEKQQAKQAALEAKKQQQLERQQQNQNQLSMPIQVRGPAPLGPRAVGPLGPQMGPMGPNPRTRGQTPRVPRPSASHPSPNGPAQRTPRPRLQVRPELRGMRPDPALLRPRGTLSVAGAPQPFQPVPDQPSIITRMPHHAHFRGPSPYDQPGFPAYRPPPGPPGGQRAPYYYPPSAAYAHNYPAHQGRMPLQGHTQPRHGPPTGHGQPPGQGPPPGQPIHHGMPPRHLPPGGYPPQQEHHPTDDHSSQRLPASLPPGHPGSPSHPGVQRFPLTNRLLNPQSPSGQPPTQQQGQHPPTSRMSPSVHLPPGHQPVPVTCSEQMGLRLQHKIQPSSSNDRPSSDSLTRPGSSDSPSRSSSPNHTGNTPPKVEIKREPEEERRSPARPKVKRTAAPAGHPLGPYAPQLAAYNYRNPSPHYPINSQFRPQMEQYRPQMDQYRPPMEQYRPGIDRYRAPMEQYRPPHDQYRFPPERYHLLRQLSPHNIPHDRFSHPPTSNYNVPYQRFPMHSVPSDRFPQQLSSHTTPPDRYPPPSERFGPFARSTPPEHGSTPNETAPVLCPNVVTKQAEQIIPLAASPPGKAPDSVPESVESIPEATSAPTAQATQAKKEESTTERLSSGDDPEQKLSEQPSIAPPPPIKRYIKAREALIATDLSRTASVTSPPLPKSKQDKTDNEDSNTESAVPDSEKDDSNDLDPKVNDEEPRPASNDISKDTEELAGTGKECVNTKPVAYDMTLSSQKPIVNTEVTAVNNVSPAVAQMRAFPRTDLSRNANVGSVFDMSRTGSNGTFELQGPQFSKETSDLSAKASELASGRDSPPREFTGLVSYFSSQHEDSD